MHISCPRDCDCFNDFVECEDCGAEIVNGINGWEHHECKGEEE